MASCGIQVAKDKGFFAWMRMQRLYYGEMLTEPAASELDRALEHAGPSEKIEILLGCRILYSILQPKKCDC
jgi:hypothetical protein